MPGVRRAKPSGGRFGFYALRLLRKEFEHPKTLTSQAVAKGEKNVEKTESSRPVEVEAANILRKSQPIAIRLWNLFALWTWLKWLIPICFMIFAALCVGFAIVLFFLL